MFARNEPKNNCGMQLPSAVYEVDSSEDSLRKLNSE